MKRRNFLKALPFVATSVPLFLKLKRLVPIEASLNLSRVTYKVWEGNHLNCNSDKSLTIELLQAGLDSIEFDHIEPISTDTHTLTILRKFNWKKVDPDAPRPKQYLIFKKKATI